MACLQDDGARSKYMECTTHIKNLDPVTGSGTGRDYEDISAYNEKVAIVFHTKPQRCKVGEDGCPKRVLGVLRNF